VNKTALGFQADRPAVAQTEDASPTHHPLDLMAQDGLARFRARTALSGLSKWAFSTLSRRRRLVRYDGTPLCENHSTP